MTREEIQADAETQVVPREVADRLAEALDIILTAEHTIEMGGWMDNYDQVAKARARKAKAMADASAALDEYRKAVADAK